jgi:plastocyanin
MYRARVWDMALTRQQEADVRRFVRRVRDALVAAEESATLYAQSQLYSGTGPGPRKEGEQRPREVGVYDNYFEPKSIEIPAGTKLRWKSHGKHPHTIMADKEEWFPMDLSPGSEVTVTFAKPGTYRYHCGIHPEDMRATIVVK